MASFIYDLNKQQVQVTEPTPSLWKLGLNTGLNILGWQTAESSISNIALTGLGAKIDWQSKGLVARINKTINQSMINKSKPSFLTANVYSEPSSQFFVTSPPNNVFRAYDILNRITKRSIPHVKSTELDMNMIGYNKNIHKAYNWFFEQMNILEKDYGVSLGQLEELVKSKGQQSIMTKQKRIITKEEAKVLVNAQKWNTAWRQVSSYMQQTQMYVMLQLGLTIGKTLLVDIPSQQMQRRAKLRYYRRLSGISGGVSSVNRNELSYSKQEEQLILRSIKQSMITRQMINDQGVFGSNPYLAIYG